MTVSVTVFPNNVAKRFILKGNNPNVSEMVITGASGSVMNLAEFRRGSDDLLLAYINYLGGMVLRSSLNWDGAAIGGPVLTGASPGAKLRLYPIGDGTLADYAVGVEAGTMWFGVPDVAQHQFRWYAGTTQVASLSGTGLLGLSTVTTAGTQGITWFGVDPTAYGIHRTGEVWSAPDYAQLRMSWVTGIIIDPGTAYGRSWLEVRGQTRMYNQVAGTVTQIIRNIAGQTADMTQWQDDLGAVLARMNNGGRLQVVHIGKEPAAANTYLNMYANVAILGVTPGNVVQIVRGAAAQTGDLEQWQSDVGVVYGRVTKTGYFTIAKVTAPPDADVIASEAQLWWDNRAGSPHLVVKGKASDGVVRSYAPSRLLAISKYTTNGAQTVHTAVTTIGMNVAFTMPALQPGQRVKIEAYAYYFYAASNIAAANSIYTFIYAGPRIASRVEYVAATSTVIQFPLIWGYVDNSQVAAGTWVTAEVYTLSSSNIAYQFVGGPEDPAYIAATIV